VLHVAPVQCIDRPDLSHAPRRGNVGAKVLRLERIPCSVIASGAKQSNVRALTLDCFAFARNDEDGAIRSAAAGRIRRRSARTRWYRSGLAAVAW
jgi:hypothetical protein